MTNDREILILYNKDSSTDRKTLAYARSVTRHLKSYTFQSNLVTPTTWQRIIHALNMHPKDLLNKAHPYYQEFIRGKEFDEEGWLNILRKNPEMIKAPIAIRGKHAILCLSPKDVYKLTSVPA